ncbi:hypothetical protein GUJ93_ZPchr0458g22699 [Zizania palustris]|uniref:Uncharacterized protein n=1 Tax=Zizania palustris TaxID=103762 RepID=A0A8J5R1U4_ZIZPA|nr:hypothetical protein GUJ93_ZPchr0458g22699 [Zizania palustris]
MMFSAHPGQKEPEETVSLTFADPVTVLRDASPLAVATPRATSPLRSGTPPSPPTSRLPAIALRGLCRPVPPPSPPLPRTAPATAIAGL